VTRHYCAAFWALYDAWVAAGARDDSRAECLAHLETCEECEEEG
jgi:hypothetical protein